MGTHKRIGVNKEERKVVTRYCKRFGLLDYEIEINRTKGTRKLYVVGTDVNDIIYRIRFDKVVAMRRPKGIQVVNRKTYLIHQANLVHGVDRYNYDLISEGDITFKNKLHIQCPTHGIFLKRKAAFITQREGCPMCSRDRSINNRKYFKR